MILKNSLEKKLLSSVFIVVTLIILLVTALVAWFEKHRYQKMEFNRLYYKTQAVKKQLISQADQFELNGIENYLSHLMSVSPDVLYVLIMDTNGRILAANEISYIGKLSFPAARVQNLSRPLFRAKSDRFFNKNPGRFEIYYARVNQKIVSGGEIRARQGEIIFDTHWDIARGKEHAGRLRMGFSMRALKQHLTLLIGGMLGSSFFVLIITLGLIYWRIRRDLRPLGTFIDKIAGLNQTKDTNQLRRQLAGARFNEDKSQVKEIRQLNQSFSKLKQRVVLDWDALEDQQSNLEQVIESRTKELNNLNIRLVRQIEERKEIETRLLNVQKLEAISTLAGGIAHEFNNLFMGITGYASLIKTQCRKGHPNAEKAAKIVDLVKQGSESIKQLLGFARGGKYSPGPLNVSEVIRVNLEMFERTRKDIEIEKSIEEVVWSIIADRSQMEHIVMNLLINASEAMPQGGMIKIATRNIVLHKKPVGVEKIASGRFVQISINDQGKGISRDVIPRIFDPFFTTKPMSVGTGLGLASVYGIVDNHGGFVTVESTVGKGTTFNVFLPASEKARNEKA